MYKVLPQMHRLVQQVCDYCGVKIAAIVVDSEHAMSCNPSLRRSAVQCPYYIVELAPNEYGWRYISCRPKKGRNGSYSKSSNNVTVVAFDRPGFDEHYIVLPSWRGRLVPLDELKEHKYHIEKGYMLQNAGIDFIETEIVERYERAQERANR